MIRVCNQVATATRVPEFWELGVPGTIMTSIDSLRLSNECGVVPRFFLYTEASTLVTRCLKGRVLRGNDWKTQKKWRCRKLQKKPSFSAVTLHLWHIYGHFGLPWLSALAEATNPGISSASLYQRLRMLLHGLQHQFLHRHCSKTRQKNKCVQSAHD